MGMTIQRPHYIERLHKVRGNGLVKIITGVRRCGKSYLLFTLFREELMRLGVDARHIVSVQLDDAESASLRDPQALLSWVTKRLPSDGKPTFVFLDEIQMCKQSAGATGPALTFYDVLNSLMKKPNVDVYVTGSNSEMLSKDVATNFRDRGTEVRVWPLSFAEYVSASGCEKAEAWERYLMWGGMPLAVLAADDEARQTYLGTLFDRIYIKDIVERYRLTDDGYMLNALIDILSSDVGSLTNPRRLAGTMQSERGVKISEPTVASYIEHVVDSFLYNKAERWDVKGKRYLSYPSKYYAVDAGLRNARLNFRQFEPSHLMENVIYNELLMRGYNVDVGVAESVAKDSNGKSVKKRAEIDFVVNRGSRKIYIQSAFAIPDAAKREQETYSLRHTGDFFKKIVIEGGFGLPRTDEDGIVYLGVIPFLMDESLLKSQI